MGGLVAREQVCHCKCGQAKLRGNKYATASVGVQIQVAREQVCTTSVGRNSGESKVAMEQVCHYKCGQAQWREPSYEGTSMPLQVWSGPVARAKIRGNKYVITSVARPSGESQVAREQVCHCKCGQAQWRESSCEGTSMPLQVWADPVARAKLRGNKYAIASVARADHVASEVVYTKYNKVIEDAYSLNASTGSTARSARK